MDTVVKLMERVNNSQLTLKDRYPELYDLDKKNIVFVSPFFNNAIGPPLKCFWRNVSNAKTSSCS